MFLKKSQLINSNVENSIQELLNERNSGYSSLNLNELVVSLNCSQIKADMRLDILKCKSRPLPFAIGLITIPTIILLGNIFCLVSGLSSISILLGLALYRQYQMHQLKLSIDELKSYQETLAAFA